MTLHDRSVIVEQLEVKWSGYPAAFQALDPERQRAVLVRQGYRRFADLLAHLMKWWELGRRNIERYACDPQFTAPPLDVDAFNAAAVQQAAGIGAEEMAAAFKAAVAAFIRFVQELPEDVLGDERVQRQLDMELFGHYEEHRLN
jgi:hypothetical protein